jgi:F-type H+-transporting ATPase subunit epsilon
VSGFTLHLQSATQYARIDGVESFVARDASGAFGLMAGAERMMTVLGYGLARFRASGGAWRYIALPGGFAYFVGGELYLSTRRYVLGDDFRTVAAAVDSTLAAEDSALRSLKDSVTRLEREMVRRLWRLGEA